MRYNDLYRTNDTKITKLYGVSTIAALQELHGYVGILGMTSGGDILNTLPTLLTTAVSKFQVTPFFKLTYMPVEQADGMKQYGIRVSLVVVFDL